jgi:hypothetical protein
MSTDTPATGATEQQIEVLYHALDGYFDFGDEYTDLDEIEWAVAEHIAKRMTAHAIVPAALLPLLRKARSHATRSAIGGMVTMPWSDWDDLMAVLAEIDGEGS